ncbi:4218_t:CDS:2, partial [Gigaspora margarita]
MVKLKLNNTNVIRLNLSSNNLNETAYYNNSNNSNDDDGSKFNMELAKEVGASTMLFRWRRMSKNLSMAYKLPFYMACFDFIIYGFQTVNMIYPLLYIANWPEPSCSVIAGGFFFGSVSSISFVGTSSIMSWLIVCKKTQFKLGAYDYKLFILPLGLSAILTGISASTFGSDQFWCYTPDKSIGVSIIIITMDLAIFIISLFCYLSILRKITNHDFKEQFSSAAKKIISYILVYIIQWIPLITYLFLDMANGLWLYFLAVGAISMGGILNAGRYILNEGWIDDPDSFVGISSNDTNARKSIKSDEIENMKQNCITCLKPQTSSLNSKDTETSEDSQNISNL